MPGPWSDVRRGVAFDVTTEWYESDLEENTEYEVEVAREPDFSDAAMHRFRTQRTDRSVELRSVTINPEGDAAVVFDGIDYSRETDGAGSGVYNHALNLVLDQPRRAAVSAVAVSSQARVVVEPASLQLAAASFPQFTVTVTNGGNTRTYRFTILPTVPDLLEFDNAGALSDIASDGTTMWGAVRTQGIQAYDFFTKQKLGDVVALRGLTRIAYDFTNETIWYTTETSAAIEIDPSSNYAATGRRITFPSTIRALSWHGDRLYAKQRANTSTWYVGNTLTAARAGSITLDVQRFGNNAEMWRNDDNYFMYNNGAVQGERFRIFNTDRTRNTALEAHFGGGDLEEWLVNAPATFWGNGTHLFVQGRNVIRAYSLVTGLREITIGANFRGNGDFQLRRGGVVNPQDLWGNSTTMWVLNNKSTLADFTGNRTKLVAFRRLDGQHDPAKDVDIEGVAEFGHAVTGDAHRIYVLSDGWIRAWNHDGTRAASHDLELPSGGAAWSAMWNDSTSLVAQFPRTAFVASTGAPTSSFRVPPNNDPSEWSIVGNVALELRPVGADHLLKHYAFGSAQKPWRCVRTTTFMGTVTTTVVTVGGNQPTNPLPPPTTRTGQTEVLSRFTVFSDSDMSSMMPGAVPYDETVVETGTTTGLTTRTVGLDGRQISGPVFEIQIRTRITKTYSGTIEHSYACENVGVSEVWKQTVSPSQGSVGLSLLGEDFLRATGIFHDGDDLWVIEPTLPVAAKFTIQGDGSIARNLS